MHPFFVVVLLLSILSSNKLSAQSIQTEVDSIAAHQFKADVDAFLKRTNSLHERASKYLSFTKEDYLDVVSGKRKDFPSSDIGKKLVLDFYAEIGKVLTILYNVEHLDMMKEKTRSEYRNLLLEFLKTNSSLIMKIGLSYELAMILEKGQARTK